MSAGTVSLGFRLPTLVDTTAVPSFGTRTEPHVYDLMYRIPQQQVREAPEIVQQLNELVQMTHWTNRTLAEILGVSHPTIGQALSGHANALSRSKDARQRLVDANTVVSRIFILAGRNPERTADALDTGSIGDQTATEHLIAGRVTKAYLTAARALRSPLRGELMVGAHPLDPRMARVAVLDED